MDSMGVSFSSYLKASNSQPRIQFQSSSPILQQTAAKSMSGINPSRGDEDLPTPTPKGLKSQPSLFSDGLDPNSSRFIAPPSAQPLREVDMEDDVDEDSVDLEEFDLEGFTQEEVRAYNSMAEPGQSLEDAVTPKKMREIMHSTSYTTQPIPTALSITKQVTLFIRTHPFLERSILPFKKSERRQFERDVYDFGEALGLDHAAAKKHVIKARRFCGEEDYDSDNSALGDEIDDSGETLKRLTAKSGSEPVVLPSIEDVETGQAMSQPGAQRSPKKSPYFGAPSRTNSTQRKRKGGIDIQQQPTEDVTTLGDNARAARRAAKKARRKYQRAGIRSQRNRRKSDEVEAEVSTEFKSNQGDHQHEDFQVPVIQLVDQAFDQALSAALTYPFKWSSCKDSIPSVALSKAANHCKTPTTKNPKSVKISPYFVKAPLKRTNPHAKVSCIPFPPLQSTSFGLVQERLSHDPFRLFIAVIFLNKTRGSVALPVFYELMERYPTPSDLSAAKHEDVVEVVQHLGLQNQRATTCINLARAWLERPPDRGKRYRLLHYPKHGDGKDIKPGEIVGEDDERVAWEVGLLPGVGAYAIDSWRIFCRDQLRGLPFGLPEVITDEEREIEMQKEWTRVLPMDKELRAYLRWRWLRNGWDWDALTGERKPAGLAEMEKAEKGGVIYESEDMGVIISEQENAEIIATKVDTADGEESKIEVSESQD